jgi:hypothetical protein
LFDGRVPRGASAREIERSTGARAHSVCGECRCRDERPHRFRMRHALDGRLPGGENRIDVSGAEHTAQTPSLEELRNEQNEGELGQHDAERRAADSQIHDRRDESRGQHEWNPSEQFFQRSRLGLGNHCRHTLFMARRGRNCKCFALTGGRMRRTNQPFVTCGSADSAS